MAEECMRVLGKHALFLDAKAKEEENEGLKGVRVNWKCQKCMKTRSRYPVWLTDRGQAATLDECGRLAAEEVLGRHAKCLGITDPRLKRNWLEQGKLDAEHEQAKKAKIEVQKQAEVQEKKSRTLEQFESNESKVSEGAAIETSSENMLTFDDPNLKDSPAFRTKKKDKRVSPWDASTPTTSSESSTHRTRLHRVLHHAKNGLIRFVRYWTFGSLMR
jgi:hypothetical protein